jgi:L-lactate dehydrogenase complex protein LldE
MIRNYYKELFADDPVNLARVNALAPNVYEFSEYLVDRVGSSGIEGLFQSSPSDVAIAFHESCHAKRELGVDSQPKALIDSVPGLHRVEMEQAEVCCGFGGTFAVKYADISGAMLRDKLDNIEASGADVVTACDSSCLMHIKGGLERRSSPVQTAHVAELIDRGIRGA